MAGLSPEDLGKIFNSFFPLNQRLRLITKNEPLLLAHYTSVDVIEQVLKNSEVWFANPLYMNDLQEMRLGIFLANQLFPSYANQAVDGDRERSQALITSFNQLVSHLEQETAIDTYIFCLCRYDHERPDGLLSMWREYGAKGEGAALVFNLQKVTFRTAGPLLIAHVVYANDHERIQQLHAHLAAWAEITKALAIPTENLGVAAYWAFVFCKLIALTTKHHGFSEENEVRVIHTPENDPLGYLKPFLHYHVGPRGVEPKLKFKFGSIIRPTAPNAPVDEFTTGRLEDLLEFFLLGPTVSSLLARRAFIRMLERNNLAQFADRVRTSTIPLRPAIHQ